MPSLRVHAKDPAIGMTSQRNLELVADVLSFIAKWAHKPVLRRLCPFYKNAQTLDLLAATFSRVRGIPEPLPSQLDARISLAMGEPRLD